MLFPDTKCNPNKEIHYFHEKKYSYHFIYLGENLIRKIYNPDWRKSRGAFGLGLVNEYKYKMPSEWRMDD